MNPFAQLFSMLIGFYVSIILLRFLLQYFRADFYNPLSQFVIKATDPLIKPLRRVIPGFAGIDFSTLVLAWLVTCAKIFLIQLISGMGISNPVTALLYSLIDMLSALIGLYIILIIGNVIISWVSPGGYNPLASVIQQLTEPFLAKFRALLPPMGGLDLSPMIALALLFFLKSSLTYYLYPLIG
ncbi:YggT family protein [Aliikangiella sp. IMCC44632]